MLTLCNFLLSFPVCKNNLDTVVVDCISYRLLNVGRDDELKDALGDSVLDKVAGIPLREGKEQ